MAARYQEGDAWLRQRSVLEDVDRYVASQVIYPVQRLSQCERERLCTGQADYQGAHQARPRRDGDAVDLGEIDGSRLAGPIESRHQSLQVSPAGDLRYDTAVACVQVHAAGNLIGKELVATDESHAGLVTRRLNAQHQRCAHDIFSSGEVQVSRSYSFMINACRPGP